MIESIYEKATEIAQDKNQLVGKKDEYYITMAQLERILMSFED